MARFAFGLTVIALMVVLVFGEFRVAEAVGDWLGYEWGPGGSLVGGCALPNIMLAHVLADRLFKALGLSRSGRMVEGRRPAVDPAASPTVEDVVEIRLGRAISNTLTVGALGTSGLVFLFAEVIIPKRDQVDRESLLWVYGLFLGMAALAYVIRYFLTLRVDDWGITLTSALPTPPERVPWSRIASCDLVVLRNTFGDVSVAYPVMKDAEGKELLPGLAVCLIWAASGDRQELLRVFKERFPKLDLDPWGL